jgi:hypothetical protein
MKAVVITEGRDAGVASVDLVDELLAPDFQVKRWSVGAIKDIPRHVKRMMDTAPDVIVLWQAESYIDAIAKAGHPNVVLVLGHHDERCIERLKRSPSGSVKVLSFSYAIEKGMRTLSFPTKTFQYFPDVATLPRVVDYSELRGFFLQRGASLDWGHVRTLMRGVQFERFTVALPRDSFRGAIKPTLREKLWGRISVTAPGADTEAFLKNTNFFVAPRCARPIEPDFLRAMGMGMAVAALDTPIMNEYITDRVNGYLFSYSSLSSLDVKGFRDVGRRARETVEIGRASWKASLPELLDFVLTPARKVPTGTSLADTARRGGSSMTKRGSGRTTGGLRVTGRRKTDSPDKPLVSVAIVVLNARDAFLQTISSILQQSYECLELLVIDAGSIDGTLEAIRNHNDSIDLWISEQDDGPYFAMNKAAQLASGRWIIFMNAGDWFLNKDSLANAIRYAPANADFVIGHHIYRSTDGVSELHKADDSASSWSILREGSLTGLWLQGIPGHQATFTRTALLREHAYDTSFQVAADHDFLYRMMKRDCRFYHCGIAVSVYTRGGFSARNYVTCVSEWERTCTAHSGNPERVRTFFRSMLLHREGQLASGSPNGTSQVQEIL